MHCSEQVKPVDRGFAGTTHILSGLAVFMLILAFSEDFMTWAEWTTPAKVILAALVICGFTLYCDFDNTISKAKVTTGYLGEALTLFFRGSAKVIQTVVRTSRDEKVSDPHRGFWHTPLSAIMLGGLTILATRNTTIVTLPLIGEVTIGWLSAFAITFLASYMGFASLFAKAIKKALKGSKSFDVVVIAIAMVGTSILFYSLPHTESFWWLGVSVTLGGLIHIFGDSCTRSGVPLLFPIPIKGKLWWKIRFFTIESGGEGEKPFIKIFYLAIAVSIIKIIISYFM